MRGSGERRGLGLTLKSVTYKGHEFLLAEGSGVGDAPRGEKGTMGCIRHLGRRGVALRIAHRDWKPDGRRRSEKETPAAIAE